MRRLIVQEWVSLDGFATDKNDSLDFFAPTVRDTYKDEYYANVLNSIDCILLGKNTYERFSATWPETSGDKLSDIMNTSEKIVFSKSLSHASWGKWRPATIVATDFQSKVKQLKSSAGRSIIIWGSLSLAQQAIKANLVDEFHIHLCPIITGGGRRLFTGENQKSLKLIHSNRFDSGVVSFHYQA